MGASRERERARDAAGALDSTFRRRWGWRTRLRVRLVGIVGFVLLRLLYATLRVRWVVAGDTLARHRQGERFVVAVWHDGLALLPLALLRIPERFRPRVLLSWHRDAEMGAQAAKRFGVTFIRGSSTRGRIGAVRGLLAAHRAGDDVVVIPDGPRGPRHVAKAGVVQVAQATGARVLPVALLARPARRLQSWDRMQIPLPFARVAIYAGEPLVVGRDGPMEQGRVQAALERVEVEAGAMLESRR